jgi:hypothetical protein
MSATSGDHVPRVQLLPAPPAALYPASPALPSPSYRVAQWLVWWINRAEAEYNQWNNQPAPKPPAPVGPMALISDRVATLAYRDSLVAMGVTPAA